LKSETKQLKPILNLKIKLVQLESLIAKSQPSDVMQIGGKSWTDLFSQSAKDAKFRVGQDFNTYSIVGEKALIK